MPENWRKEVKLSWLAEQKHVGGVPWQTLNPDKAHAWVVTEGAEEFAGFISIGNKAAKAAETNVASIFKTYGRGVASNADGYVYDFDRERLVRRAHAIVEDFNSTLDRWKRQGKPEELESFLKVDEKVHKWIRNTRRTLLRGEHAAFKESNIRNALYRPFVKQFHFFAREFNEDTYQLPRTFPTPSAEQENTVICVPGIGGRANWATVVAKAIPNLSLTSLDSFQVFPFYVYDDDGSNKRENITDWALDQFRTHYRDPVISKWSIFDYVYGLLHHPGYRAKFADNLKRELPRIPFAPDFRAFQLAGQKLIKLHLDYEKLDPYDLQLVETAGEPLSYRVDDKMRLSKDKTKLTVNKSLTLAGIPPAALDYRLGNRSALEWVVDQYQVHTDPRSGITSDPNRPDDPQYIVRLVGQVVRVSVETVGIVAGLPKEYSDSAVDPT